MPEIRTIGINEIRSWNGPAPMSVPTAPPVTVNIGVPIVDLPSFNAMDYRPEALVFDPVAPVPKTSTPEVPRLQRQPRQIFPNRKRQLTRILGALP